MRRGGSKKGSQQHRVHEAVMDGRIRRVKFCPACEEEKVAEDGASDSGFHVHTRSGRQTVVFYTHCKDCRRRLEHERRERDPAYRERVLAQQRAARERWLAKEQNQEKARVACLAYYYRRAESDREGINAAARMGYALRIERLEGRAVNHPWTVTDGTRPRKPAEPFRSWLIAYRDLVGCETDAALARELGMSERRVRSVLAREYEQVAFDVVDRALTNSRIIVGQVVTIDDLYPPEEARAA